MAKIGIMSMQRIKNYGSFLQAYSLKKIIEHLGHDVEFVDYHIGVPIKLQKQNKIILKYQKILNILKNGKQFTKKIQFLIHKKQFSKRYNKFLNITKQYNYNTVLDTLVIGSDEVFNCLQNNIEVGFSPELFGLNNNAKKVITYAASFGNTTISKLKKFKIDKEIANYLKKIDVISVRDENSKNIIKKLTARESYDNLDPTLIYDYSTDLNFKTKTTIKQKYIILYAYNNRITKEEAYAIKKYADKNNCKIYSIGGVHTITDRFIDCSPFELLNYFKDAHSIITDTFHGSIFSIIQNKQFLTIIRKSNDGKYGNEEKIISLLKKFNLTDRVISNLNNIDIYMKKKINFDYIKKIIEAERKKTYDYLLKNID